MKFFRRSKRVTADMSFALTEAGKKRAEEFAGSGGRWEILAALREQGASSLSELANETGYSTERLKPIIRSLERSGYVRYMGSED
jgi:DNA-binding MarR family transcriptional regulator